MDEVHQVRPAPAQSPEGSGSFARGAVGERVCVRVSVYACTWGNRGMCAGPPRLQTRAGSNVSALTSPLWGPAGCPPTSGFSFLPRASISRDPFYDMLATRKRRIANKK